MGTDDFRNHYDEDSEDSGLYFSRHRCRGCGGQIDQDESVFCLDCHARGCRIGGKVDETHLPQMGINKKTGRFGNLV